MSQMLLRSTLSFWHGMVSSFTSAAHFIKQMLSDFSHLKLNVMKNRNNLQRAIHAPKLFSTGAKRAYSIKALHFTTKSVYIL